MFYPETLPLLHQNITSFDAKHYLFYWMADGAVPDTRRSFAAYIGL